MGHKFKIGELVYYRPKGPVLSTARGTYAVARLMPSADGRHPQYCIRHSVDFERIVLELELSVA